MKQCNDYILVILLLSLCIATELSAKQQKYRTTATNFGFSAENAEIDGNLNINSASSSTAGQILQDGVPLLHSYDPSGKDADQLFVGLNSGNFTMTGQANTGIGSNTLNNLQSGATNVAIGTRALQWTSTGTCNHALGVDALGNNLTGSYNVGIGNTALQNCVDGNSNTAVGVNALNNTNASQNTAVGQNAGQHLMGNNNCFFGYNAGLNLQTGDNNVYIAHEGGQTESGQIRIGTGSQQTDCYIAGIYLNGLTDDDYEQMYVDSNGKLGILSSSERFKENIESADAVSPKIFELNPVTYDYKERIDQKRSNQISTSKENQKNSQKITKKKQFGLIAEEVEKVLPDLVNHDSEGKPHSVQYNKLIPLLLNELKRLNTKVEQQDSVIKQLQSKH